MSRLFELANTPYPRFFKSLHQSGIQAASLPHWVTLRSTATLIEKPAFATLKVRETMARLKQTIAKAKTWEAAPYQALLHWARLIQPPYLKWQQQHMQRFNDPLWWHRCAEKIQTFPIEDQADAHIRLFDLQQKWAGESDYAHYSTLDVLHVYQRVIPVFAEWLTYAQTEWIHQRDRLSPELAQPYQAYLIELSRLIQAEKVKLRGCLQGRLALSAHTGDGSADQIIPVMINELSTMGLLPKPRQNTVSRGYLTPHLFVAIRNIIEKDGDLTEKQAFYALPYHAACQFDKPLALAHPYRINADGCSYLIPPARSEMMPTHPPFYLKLPTFLHQLFWGDIVIYTFFQHDACQMLLAQNALRRVQPTDVTTPLVLTEIRHHPAWQQGQVCLQILDAEGLRTLSWLKRAWLFLFPAAKALLAGYQTDLQQDAQQWAKQQLTCLQVQIRQQPDALRDPKAQAAVKAALADLAQTHERWHFASEWVTQLQTVQRNVAALCQGNEVDTVPSDHLVASPTLPELPLREAFPLALKQVVHLVKHTQTVPAQCLTALETQLNTETPDYDSVQLRLTLTDYLAQTPECPHTLKAGLQAVLDEPRFSEAKLHLAENIALGTLKKTNVPMASPLRVDQANVLQEDSWHHSHEVLIAHCQRLKASVVPLSYPASVAWKKSLCEYTHRFLRHMQQLPNWQAFAAQRDSIELSLKTLIEISHGICPTLHRMLDTIAREQDQLEPSDFDWELFVESTLNSRVQALAAYLNPMSVNSVTSEALSYNSQKALDFLRRCPSTVEASSNTSSMPAKAARTY